RVCIDAQRRRFAAFRIGFAGFAVEDVIRADMDEDGIQIVCDPYQVQNGEDVDRIRKFGLKFAIIDAMIRRCIQDQVGPQIHKSGSNLRVVRNIEISSRQGMHLMRAKCSLQVLSELSAGAKECDFHMQSAIKEAYSKTTLWSDVISMRFPQRGLLQRRT